MIGKTISHYRVETELGRGGMGVVYRAHDQRLNRPVALKLLSGEMAGQAQRRARILAEARAAAALNHPGITAIYEVGEDGEHIFIVMELVSGRTLREVLSETRPDARALARLGLQIAETLEAAHSRKVVHGDVKPENIIVSPEGRVKLLDFGIARQAVEDTLSVTRTASAAPPVSAARMTGTLAYLSPESLRGEVTDGRGDLFALGVVLFELAAGHRPFPGPTASLLMSQILEQTAPPLTTAPPELARIIHKLLEKSAGSRYQSAADLRVDLNNFLRDIDVSAPPPGVKGKRAVAVLPFKLLPPNPEDEYLGVALADALVNAISAGGEWLVRPTSAVMRYAHSPADPLDVARELNVQAIVDGSIQKFGQKLRVHVQAWNAADGSTLFSLKQDSEMADLFGLQDRISDGLARALGMRTETTDSVPERPTKNTQAYELYLRAVERLTRLNRWDTLTAIEMLQAATRLDPRFAEAWARLAEGCVMMAGTFDPSPRWIRLADQACQRALRIDANNAEAHCAKGRLLWTPAKHFQNRPALRALASALRLNPGSHAARVWQCLVFLHVGLLEKALEGLQTTLAAQPNDGFTLTFLGQTLQFQGVGDEAAEYFSRALALDPSSLWATLFYPGVELNRGKQDAAEMRIRLAEQLFPGDPLVTSYQALLWALRGEQRKAEQVVRKTFRGAKSMLHTHHAVHNVAAVYALTGKPARAVAMLEKASGTGLPNYPLFRDDPHLRPLHSYAPYHKLLAKLRREWESYRQEFARR